MESLMGNPWNVQSLCEFQYFHCPSCLYIHNSKQDFVCHAFDTHPESVEFFKNISDGSLSDILPPWGFNDDKSEVFADIVKTEMIENDEDFTESNYNELDNDEFINVKKEFVFKEEPKNDDEQYYPVKKRRKNILTSLVKQPGIDEDDPKKSAKKLKKNNNKTIHDEGYDENKEYICGYCSQAFGKQYRLKVHIFKLHEFNENHKCECGKCFMNENSLQRHTCKNKKVDDKSEPIEHICECCGKIFPSAAKIKSHLRKLKQERHPCSNCEKSFLSVNALIIHNNSVHEGRKDHICDLCGKSFTTKGGLTYHIKILHYKKKDFKCDQCHKIFGRANLLKCHFKAVHDGQRDTICNLCGKTFTQNSALRRHINSVHEKRYNFKCINCGKTFGSKTKLVAHIRAVHEGRKDFKCNFCQNAYSTAQILRSHISSAHPNEYKNTIQTDHKCDLCGKTFPLEGNLNIHIHLVHEGLLSTDSG